MFWCLCQCRTRKSIFFFRFLSAYFSFALKLFLAHQIRTNFSFVRTSFTDDSCFVIWAMSASESANDMSNRSRSGLRWNGPRVGVVLRARRLNEETSSRQTDRGKRRREPIPIRQWIVFERDFWNSSIRSTFISAGWTIVWMDRWRWTWDSCWCDSSWCLPRVLLRLFKFEKRRLDVRS